MKKDKVKKYPQNASEVLVTQNMLYAVRDELIEHTDSKFHELKSEIHGVKSDVHELKSEIHGIRILVEEQNAKNNIVLDGLTSLFERQERIEFQFK